MKRARGHAKSLSHVRPFVTPQTVACQAPLSTGFSRQEYVLEWAAMPSSRASSRPRDRTPVSSVSCADIHALYH